MPVPRRRRWRGTRTGRGSRVSAVLILGIVATSIQLVGARVEFRPRDGTCVIGIVALVLAAVGISDIKLIFAGLAAEPCPSWSAWRRSRQALASALARSAAPGALAFLAITASHSVGFIVGMAVVLAVAGTLVWVLTDRGVRLHSADAPELDPSQPLREISSPTLLMLLGFVLLVGTGLPFTQPQRIALVGPERRTQSTAPTTTQSTTTIPTGVPGSAGKGAPPSTVAERNCDHWPGSGVPEPIASMMRRASEAGADATWGCVGPVTRFADGSYQQAFERSSAFLVGSQYGAGIVDDAYSRVVLERAGGEPSRTNLGGQVLDRIDCWDRRGDFVVIVGEDRNVVAIFGRGRKVAQLPSGATELPVVYQVHPRLLDDFASRVKQLGSALAPVEDAFQDDVGRVAQRFSAPGDQAPDNVVLGDDEHDEPSGFRAEDLFLACSAPGAAVPDYLSPPPSIGS